MPARLKSSKVEAVDMRLMALGLTAAMLAVLLSGCSGGGAKPDGRDPFASGGPTATATTGVLRGIVVDDAIRPLVGATVYLTPATPPLTATTNDLGAFSFDKLKPGTYFVQATKGGFATAQQSSDVVAGVSEPPIVKIQLLRDASYVPPYVETYVFDGFMECSGGTAVDSGDYAVDNACSSPAPGVNPFPNDNTFASYNLSKAPTWVQGEMVWDSTQAASKSLNMNFAIADSTAQDGWDDLGANGPSPLLNTMDEKVATHYVGKDNVINIRVFPWSDSYPGAIVAVEQKFTVYVHVFYGYVPPADWRFSSGDPVPAPPV